MPFSPCSHLSISIEVDSIKVLGFSFKNLGKILVKNITLV